MIITDYFLFGKQQFKQNYSEMFVKFLYRKIFKNRGKNLKKTPI